MADLFTSRYFRFWVEWSNASAESDSELGQVLFGREFEDELDKLCGGLERTFTVVAPSFRRAFDLKLSRMHMARRGTGIFAVGLPMELELPYLLTDDDRIRCVHSGERSLEPTPVADEILQRHGARDLAYLVAGLNWFGILNGRLRSGFHLVAFSDCIDEIPEEEVILFTEWDMEAGKLRRC